MIDYSQVRQFSVRHIAELTAEDLKVLKSEAEDVQRQAKEAKEWIDIAIGVKYQDRVETLRREQDKETGVVRFLDGDIRIAADLPKKLIWNQKKLATLAERIRTSGEDPNEFIDISYKVAERKYTAWPESLRASFSSARTLKTGKQTFVFGEADV
jgi:hypothetical protein